MQKPVVVALVALLVCLSGAQAQPNPFAALGSAIQQTFNNITSALNQTIAQPVVGAGQQGLNATRSIPGTLNSTIAQPLSNVTGQVVSTLNNTFTGIGNALGNLTQSAQNGTAAAAQQVQNATAKSSAAGTALSLMASGLAGAGLLLVHLAL